MELFPKARIPYFINTPSYSHISSGVRTLHLLCHALNESGQIAYLLPMNNEGFAANPYLNTPFAKTEHINLYNHTGIHPIVIYPDTVRGNPTNARKVVRYLLAPPGIYGGDATFPPADKIWCYTPTIAGSIKGSHVLRIPTFDHNIFYPPPPGTRRQGSCFYAHKYDRIHKNPLLDITQGFTRLEGTPDQLATILRKSEVCYTYEPSEVVVTAELCGCPVVMIRTPYFDRLTPQNPDHTYYSARWHDDPKKPIDHDKLAADARAACQKLENELVPQLTSFIEDTQAWTM